MGTKRVKVPQDSGSIAVQSVNLGYVLDEKFTVHGGFVEVPEEQVDLFLKTIDGSSVVDDAPKASSGIPADKTEKK